MEWVGVSLGLVAVLGVAGVAVGLLRRGRSGEELERLRLQLEQVAGQLDRSQRDAAEQTARRLAELERKSAEATHHSTVEMGQRMDGLTREIGMRLGEVHTASRESQKTLGERLDNAAKVIQGVESRLGELKESSKRIAEVGGEMKTLVSGELKTLSDILKNPKWRGNFGEILLAGLLEQVLPPDRYVLQHRFRTGDTVDALIRLTQGDVPVDAKFPLENYRRMRESPDEAESARRKFLKDVRNRIDEIASKYILAGEGTLDFALMYVPAESVYYEILNDGVLEESLIGYALRARVIPVSPSSFYAYLAAIVFGLKGLKIEENAKLVMEKVSQLSIEFAKFQQVFNTLGKHLTNAEKNYDELRSMGGKFEARLQTVSVSTEAVALGEAEMALPLNAERTSDV